MRLELEEIQRIEAYLLGEMSLEERNQFEQNMKADDELKQKVTDQQNLTDALERLELANSINRARTFGKSGKRNKWKWGGGLLGGLLLIVSGFLFFKDSQPINAYKFLKGEDSVIAKDSTQQKFANDKMIENTDSVVYLNREKPLVIQDSDSDTVVDLSDFYGSVKLKEQTFTIDPTKPQTITGNQGTIIEFPANTLNYEGRYPKKPVTVKLTEFRKLSDMVQGNLTTMTDDGELLESGGMIKLNAYYQGKELSLSSNKPVSIKLPASTNKERMFTFDGKPHERDEVTWTQQTETPVVYLSAVAESERSEKIAVPISPGNYVSDELTIDFDDLEVAEVNDSVSRDAMKLFNEPDIKARPEDGWDFLKQVIENRLKGYKVSGFVNKKVHVSFDVDSKGNLNNIQLNDRIKAHPELEKIILYTLKKSSPWVPASKRGIPVRDAQTKEVQVNVKGLNSKKEIEEYNAQNWPWNNIDPDKIQNPNIIMTSSYWNGTSYKASNSTISDVSSAFEGYVMTSMKLGWINCDRFSRTNAKKTTIRVDPGEFHSGGLSMKLIFKDINAIMRAGDGRNYRLFQKVPVGKNATVIAIKRLEDKFYISSKDIVISPRKTIKLDDFKLLNKENLETELDRLDR